MARLKSPVLSTQSPPRRPSTPPPGVNLACKYDSCQFSTLSVDELAKHVNQCIHAVPTSSLRGSPDENPDMPNGDAASLVNVPKDLGLLNDEPIENVAADDASSALSEIKTAFFSNYSELNARFAPEAHEEHKKLERLEEFKRLDETIRAYVDKKTSYENSKEPKSKLSDSNSNPEDSETPDDEPAADDLQDLGDVINPPTPKSPQAVGATASFKFDDLTPVIVFEEYLAEVQSMSYEEVHYRTSKITEVMLEYQAEWDKIDKECRDHEEAEKLKSMTTAEKEKALADDKQEEEDLVLVSLEEQFREELKLSRRPWVEEFSVAFLEQNQDGQVTLDRLNKLRDTSFFKGFKKRQRAMQDNRPEQLIDKPLPDPKQSKEERDLEARKRRHLTDAITFDDQLQADTYGFTYLASDLARGNQLLLPKVRVASLPKPLKAGTRPNRNATKGSVVESAENSEVQSGDDELPQKRNRGKPKNFDADGGASSAAESSKGTGSSKTYIDEDGKKRYVNSGKMSGRPPVSGGKVNARLTKSKLDQMSLAQQGEQSDDVDDEEDHDNQSLNGQVLSPGQEDELRTNVADLVKAVSPVEIRKRGGGRPRKFPLVPQDDLPDSSKSPRKLKAKGSLKGKKVAAGEEELAGAPEDATLEKSKPGRKKRVREDDATELVDIKTESDTRRVKTESKTIKLRMKHILNGPTESGEQGNPVDGVPMTSIEPHVQSTQSSRPTTSSSKPTSTSKPTSRAGSATRGTAARRGSRGASRGASQSASLAASKPPAFAANINSQYPHDYNGNYGAYGAHTGAMAYGGHLIHGVPPTYNQPPNATFAPSSFYGSSHQQQMNGAAPPQSYGPPQPGGYGPVQPGGYGPAQSAGYDVTGVQKPTKKPQAKRKRKVDGEDGVTTADGTNNNTDAEGGPSKRSKKSREKTEAEKESQSAAMKAKWALPGGKMRQGIERRKRRDIRKGIEKLRVDSGGDVDPNVVYKSDDEGFSYAKWGETPPPPPQPEPPVAPNDSTPIQTPDLATPAGDGDGHDEPGDEFAVESPKTNKLRMVSADAPVVSTTGFEPLPQPSRKTHRFGGDGAADDDLGFATRSPHRPAPLLAQKPRSTYEEFQSITSPGHHLAKRVSKPKFGYGGHNTSEEEEY